MKKTLKSLTTWRLGIAAAIILGFITTSRAGLLQTQSNPVNFGANYWASPASWDALNIPHFQSDTASDGTHSRDIDFISIAHDDYYFYVRIHSTLSPTFGGDYNVWLDTDVNPATGAHNWSGTGSIGSEYLITGAALIRDPYTWIFVDWLNWDQTAWDTAAVPRDVFFSINRQTQLSNVTAFNFIFQFYNSADSTTGDWYPDSADSSSGDYFQYNAQSPTAGTVLTFDGVASDTVITNGFGGFAAASSIGVSVTSNGTPDINLLWAATGDAGTEWEFYNDTVWSAAQLNSCDVGEYYDLHFAPTVTNKSVVINSFDFHGYYNDSERFTFGMEIWDNGTLLTNWNYSFLSDGTPNHRVNVNFTGQAGHELVLSFNRNTSTLGAGETEGDPGDIAVDNISFSEVVPPVVVPTTVTFSGRTWNTLVQVASAQYSPSQTNSYVGLGNTGTMTGRFGIDSAMTTPVAVNVGDKVDYDFFITDESRNLRGTGASDWFGSTGTGFQNGVGAWVTDRNTRGSSSRWDDYFTSPGNATDEHVYYPRSTTQSTHLTWTFNSVTSAIVTLTLQGEVTPYATWTNTFNNITNIQVFWVGLGDSEQDVVLSNFTMTSAATSVHAAIVRADSPTAFWRLDETTGPTALDSVGTNNGTYTGTVTYGVTGALPTDADTAVEFDGSSGYAAVPYSAALNPQGAFSVEVWVRPNVVPNSSGTPCPISSAEFSGNRSGWQIRERDTGWQFVLYTHNSSTVANDGLANTAHGGVPSTGSWTHLVGIYDGTNSYLYVNGAAFSASAPGYVANYNDGVNAPGPLTIGARSSLDNYFSGRVDEAVVYNRALSAAEVQSHFVDRPRLNFSSSGSNLLLTWPVGTLLQSTNVLGPYTPVPSATSPVMVLPAGAGQKFFRVQM